MTGLTAFFVEYLIKHKGQVNSIIGRKKVYRKGTI
jgi:hypothetical protein